IHVRSLASYLRWTICDPTTMGRLFLNARDLVVLIESSEQTSNRPFDSENCTLMAGAMAMAWMLPSLSTTPQQEAYIPFPTSLGHVASALCKCDYSTALIAIGSSQRADNVNSRYNQSLFMGIFSAKEE